MVDDPGCVLCDPERADRELGRVTVWTDGVWRLAMSLEAEVPGFGFLEPVRHVPHITDLDGEEAAVFGRTLARVTAILKDEAGGELAYVFVFGGGVRHLHVHLAPHRDGDAINTRLIRGNVVEERLPSGDLREEQLRALAERVRRRLAEHVRAD